MQFFSKHWLRAVVSALLLLHHRQAFADNKFIIIQPGCSIPEDRFIYTLVDIHTGEIHLGYSPSAPQWNGTSWVGGVRNGGHNLLLMHALGIDRLDPKMFRGECGRFAGGGFVVHDGAVVLHPRNSYHANGLTNRYHYINPMLPSGNDSFYRHGAAHVPEYCADMFHGAIAKRTQLPLRLSFSEAELISLYQVQLGDAEVSLLSPRSQAYVSSAQRMMLKEFPYLQLEHVGAGTHGPPLGACKPPSLYPTAEGWARMPDEVFRDNFVPDADTSTGMLEGLGWRRPRPSPWRVGAAIGGRVGIDLVGGCAASYMGAQADIACGGDGETGARAAAYSWAYMSGRLLWRLRPLAAGRACIQYAATDAFVNNRITVRSKEIMMEALKQPDGTSYPVYYGSP